MAKVKDRLLLESRKLTAVAERRTLRDGARHAKQVQVERLKAKALERRAAGDSIKQWQRRRGDAEHAGAARERDLESALAPGAHSFRRKGKEAKYGHGGQKRYRKDNDAKSSRDFSAFKPAQNRELPPGLAHKSRGSGNKAGGARAGKRARDAKRSGGKGGGARH